MAEPTKKKKGFWQRLAKLLKDFVEWVEETFEDPAISREVRSDLGLDPNNPATPALPDGARRARIDEFIAKGEGAADVDEASLAGLAADIKAEFDNIVAFVEAASADQVDPRVLMSSMFRTFALDVLRVRNPAAYALVRILGLVADDEEFLQQLDAARLQQFVRGEGPAVDGEAFVQRMSMLGGVGLVLLATLPDKIGAKFDAIYGWDPDPEDEGESAAIASRALTITLDQRVSGVRPALTIIPVPRGHGRSGFFLSATTGFTLPVDLGTTTYTFDVAGAGQFGFFIPLDFDDVITFADFEPRIRVGAEPKKSPDTPADTPAVLVGTTDGSRLELGAFAFGIEISGESAAFRAGIKRGKLVIALGKGDAFLRQLPGGNIEVPFEVGVRASTRDGVHLEGGTRARVNLPVSATAFGVFTVQFLELELIVDPEIALALRAGVSLTLGPFAASIDRVGVTLELHQLGDGDFDLAEFVSFAPPKGIGLVIGASAVTGGGYLFIDSERGEYAGALELKFANWSLKAIGMVSTKRPDGSDGWSLLLFVFGQFKVHIAFGIFWTGVGGMIGLHHRSDVDALGTGMRTGALDDVLFPQNPVADAPRIVNRYRTLFPIAGGNLVFGLMFELSFSDPPIVYVRLGLIVDARNALGPGSFEVSKAILIGQVLVQLPPRDTGAPAILKLLIDIVGFYDDDTGFLLVRARLRDSFVGIEGFTKLDLAGELLVAVQFGADEGFVLSAGGFHPRYQGLPARVPRDLDKLRVSFKLGPVSLAIELYVAVTPNSVQGGLKATMKADFKVASIEAALGFDALWYRTPRSYFLVDMEFTAKVKAFGRTLAAVKVTATLEGPDEWHFVGTFSFSILWWDKTVPFDERWGEVRVADVAQVSLGEVIAAEMAKPDNVTIELPSGVANPLTFASSPQLKLAHPLGRLAIRQRAAPIGLQLQRLGTRPIAGGPQTIDVASVALNDAAMTSFEHTTESFSRGEFVDLTDDEKLTGPAFEPFPSGVIVGSSGYVTADGLARDVTAAFETVRFDPEPESLMTTWTVAAMPIVIASHDAAMHASQLGAAARSDRAEATLRIASPLNAAAIAVDEPPLALVAQESLNEAAVLEGPAIRSLSLAAQAAAAGGHRVVERFEVMV